MGPMLVARTLARGYITLAEGFRVGEYTQDEDVVVGAKLGDAWIGVVVVRMEEDRAVVRAWTTKMRYRSVGLGGDLVRHAWIEMRKRLGRRGKLVLDPDIVHARLVLPEMFSAIFRRKTEAASRLFDDVVKEMALSERNVIS